MQANEQKPEKPEASSQPRTTKKPTAEASLSENVSQEPTQASTSETSASDAQKVPEAPFHNHKTHATPKASKASPAKNANQQHKPTGLFPDYTNMSLEKLLSELHRLLKRENIQAINQQVRAIKREFDQKFQALIAYKKQEFIADGGRKEDFQYHSVTKKQFDALLAEYREKRDQYHQQQAQTLNNNLQKRLTLIEQLKSLVTAEENSNTTYKTFKQLQEQWRHAGPVPPSHYNDLWRTYHHHVEIFYDFLQLNREMRDRDFKHHLNEKQKLISRAEALAQEPDLHKALKELQVLHNTWREATGPVAKEHREATWQRFSKATAVLHQRKERYFQELEKEHEKNLEKKTEIITSLRTLTQNASNDYKTLQQQILQVEALRQAFWATGKVPQKHSEQTWTAFKEAMRQFNHHKNTCYKARKKEQQHNLEQKKALLALALSLKDSENWEKTTPEIKRLQREWKNTGPVPKKASETLWNAFKEACTHYFKRLHAQSDKSQQEEYQNFEKKKACLEQLKALQLSGDTQKDLATLNHFLETWKQCGYVPQHKKYINAKFHKMVDTVFKKIGISPQQAELLKYGGRLQQLTRTTDAQTLHQEQTFIKRKIKESKSQIRQLENNLQFFSDTSANNPLVQKVINTINQQKKALEIWKAKLKRLQTLQSNPHKQPEDNSSQQP